MRSARQEWRPPRKGRRTCCKTWHPAGVRWRMRGKWNRGESRSPGSSSIQAGSRAGTSGSPRRSSQTPRRNQMLVRTPATYRRVAPRSRRNRRRSAAGGDSSRDASLRRRHATLIIPCSSRLQKASNPVGATIAGGTGIAEENSAIRAVADKLIPARCAVIERRELDPFCERCLQHASRL
jgi:hypothetical protein